MRIALKFAYNGIDFHGLSRQPDVNTVEGKIINSLIQKELIRDIKNSNIRFASRTDKGVSAFGNVLSIDLIDEKNILNELNTDFDDIIFYGITNVDSTFNPRHAKQRIYRYYISGDYQINEWINLIDIFKGEHDYSNFARIEKYKNPVKKIDDILIRERDSFCCIEFYAHSFLWHQIRKIMSALIKFEKDKISSNDIIEALINPDKKIDFGLASSTPLVLFDVKYDLNFNYDKKELEKLLIFKKNLLNDIFKYHVD